MKKVGRVLTVQASSEKYRVKLRTNMHAALLDYYKRKNEVNKFQDIRRETAPKE